MKFLISWTLVALTAAHASAAATQHPRLVRAAPDAYTFANVVISGGVLKQRIIHNYNQQDLAQDKIYSLVDNITGETFYWIGRLVPDETRNALVSYVNMHAQIWNKIFFSFQKQGEERPDFTKAFDTWDKNMWQVNEPLRIPRGIEPGIYKQLPRVVRAAPGSYTLNRVVMEGGVMKETRINNYSQKDLAQDKMYSLVRNSNGDTIFWIGRLVPAETLNALVRYMPIWYPRHGRHFSFQRQGEEDSDFIAGFNR